MDVHDRGAYIGQIGQTEPLQGQDTYLNARGAARAAREFLLQVMSGQPATDEQIRAAEVLLHADAG